MTLTLVPNNWPAVVIGAVLAIYWLKVMQMVRRSRRTVGRAANFIPPERLGRIVRIVWIPVVLLWIFNPLLTPFVNNLPLGLRPLSLGRAGPLIGWIAAVVAVAAFAATWVCWIKMGTSWRMGIDPNERTQLVLTGPYAFVRHPIYALSQVLGVAALLAVPSPLMILVVALHLLFMQWEVRREEKYLVILHGQAYADYTARVGRFFPRLWNKSSSS